MRSFNKYFNQRWHDHGSHRSAHDRYLKLQRLLRIVSRTGLLIVSLFALNGCLNTDSSGQVSALMAGGIPDHSAFVGMSCDSCHAQDRPAPTIDTVTGVEIVHGGGRDCGECHVAGAPNWRTFVPFNHSPLPATCNDCHLAARPTADRQQLPPHLSGCGRLRGLSRSRRGSHVDWRNLHPRTSSRELRRMSLGPASDYRCERLLARRRRHGRLRELSP